MGNVTATEEVWMPVRGFEERYEVSNWGRVRGLNRTQKDGRRLKGKILTPRKKASGHLAVCLYDERGAQSQLHIHRLVLLGFTEGPPEGKPLVLHRDDNPGNNHLSNLRWGDKRDNARDSVANGRHRATRITHCPRGHELVAPNLVPDGRPGRRCYACHLGLRRRPPADPNLVLQDLKAGWVPRRGKAIAPGTFGADKTPDH